MTPFLLVPQPTGFAHIDATPEQVRQTLVSLRRQAAQRCPLPQRLEDLNRWLDGWRRPDGPDRLRALPDLVKETGLTEPALQEGLNRLFAPWTLDGLTRRVAVELGTARAGAQNRPVAPRDVSAIPLDLVVHVLAGSVPPPTFQTLLDSLLAGNAAFLKASHTAWQFARHLLESLHRTAPQLHGWVALGCWPGGQEDLEAPMLTLPDAVVAFGSDATLRAIRGRLGSRVKWIPRGHRVSAAYVTREALTPASLPALVRQLAIDAVLFDQQGCLSPQVVLVEEGGELSAEALAEALAGEGFAYADALCPVGDVAMEARAAYHQYMAVLEFTGRVWHRAVGGVALARVATLDRLSPGRTLLVRPVSDWEDARDFLAPVEGALQAVAVAGPAARVADLAGALATLGCARVCGPGELQQPGALWTPDGMKMLAELSRWMCYEQLSA